MTAESGEGAVPPRRAQVVLPADVKSVPRARGFVGQMLAVWHCEDPEEIVALLTSEVVTNAVRHAATVIQLAVQLEDEGLVLVETVDDHPAVPMLRELHTDREDGRGMWMVERLAQRWGVRPLPDGRKVVWFEVHLALCGGAPQTWWRVPTETPSTTS
ncbi:MAG: ATP-binding protein [Acidimicrobiales bacterium]